MPRAVFLLALEKQTIDDVKTELDSLLVFAAEEKDFFAFLDSPYFNTESKKNLVERVFAGHLSELTTNFLYVVVRNSRAAYLPFMIREYNQLWLNNYDCWLVVATVSEQIGDERKRSLHHQISAAIRKNIELKVVVDPSIIGGTIIRYGDNLIDNSIRKRLTEAVETIKYNCSQRGRIDEI